jgi:hypothetical protein
MKSAVVALVVLALARIAGAYPQFQLSKDQTCTGCHISPSGGLLLNENGLNVAEAFSTYGGDPAFVHGKLDVPSWLQFGGDLRGGAGLIVNRGPQGGAFPMQADVYGAAHGHDLTLVATFGFQRGSTPQTYIASREHWLMWHPGQDENDGVFLRIGRFMPVYGLRFAEHDVYTRRFGQTPLYSETYGVAAAYIEPGWEVHLTGFVHDPLQDSTEPGDGVAGYGEYRFSNIASIGLESRYAQSDAESRLAGGVTAKYWLEVANLLFEGELQAIHQTLPAGANRDQIVSYLMGTWFFKNAWMLDVGVGQFNQDLAVQHLDWESIDANVHWFPTSHLELLITNRIQTFALGAGGVTSGYSILQVHYRL